MYKVQPQTSYTFYNRWQCLLRYILFVSKNLKYANNILLIDVTLHKECEKRKQKYLYKCILNKNPTEILVSIIILISKLVNDHSIYNYLSLLPACISTGKIVSRIWGFKVLSFNRFLHISPSQVIGSHFLLIINVLTLTADTLWGWPLNSCCSLAKLIMKALVSFSATWGL